ncbi:hypothetical protein JCM16161A_03840 [Vulcanisaeta sp. JCM 16161]|uniref:hypothetical protein n=1 Tax=Vulcanisaeta sp. JCM 16161 TaxID=1295372 RepID=UPI000AD80703|nr:hypothetical protein [Vulcanisaeta sp. JCM 16161]
MRNLKITRYLGVVSLLLLTVGLILLVIPPGQGEFITYTCMNGELRGNTTCVFPQAVRINNYVVGDALVSVNYGQPERLINGSIIAHEVMFIPVINYVKVFNQTQVMFNIYNPTSKWVNITLPGSCILTVNATILGSGYVSITVVSDGRVIAYTPYTYSLFTSTYANDSIDLLIKPAVPLSCPCINTIVNVVLNGTCIERSNAFITSTARVSVSNTINTPYRTYALMLLLISLVIIAISIVPGIRR